MVKAELSYNPYIQNTIIRFNGQEPKINSLVERYQDGFLEDWVKDLPEIFYGEMNGYNFELDFSGTDLDFEEIRQSFIQAGVSEDQVKVFHKGQLKDRLIKNQNLQELLNWLDNNPNHVFDKDTFFNDNEKILENALIIKVINAKQNTISDIDLDGISVESFNSIDELTGTDLRFVPVVFVVDKDNVRTLFDFITAMNNKKDVSNQQLFFIISPTINKNETERMIQDLGLTHPRIVESIDDSEIKKYFEVYPISDYIHETIKKLESEKQSIESFIREETTTSVATNSTINQEIEKYDGVLSNLKQSYDLFSNRDNLDLSKEFMDSKEKMIFRIRNWKSRKSKTANDDEAERLADDLNVVMFRAIGQFTSEIDNIIETKRKYYNCELQRWYYRAMCDDENPIIFPVMKQHQMVFLPTIAKDLLDIHSEEDSISDKKAVYSFNGKKTEESEITWSLQKWRKYVESIVSSKADELIKECTNIIKQYYDETAELYMDYLNYQINSIIEKRESAAALLSDDAKRLQEDKEWYEEYNDKLTSIERG